jgi:putative ABC transport system ATP-binding protein
MIRLDRVSHYYGTDCTRRQVLFDVCASVAAGEIVLLTGPSGSGKSTLLALVGALRSAQEGRLTVLGEELRDASADVLIRVRRQIGYIFQKHNLLECLTVLQNVQVSLAPQGGSGRRTARQRAAEVLEAVGLSACLDRYPRQLSGGQQQRVAIARALAARPRLILADEPTASLDSATGAEVAARIRALAKQEGCAAVVVTHDQRILRIADRVLEMEDGRLRANEGHRLAA